MRIWVDLTAPAHPVVFRPLLTRLRARGHELLVTARDYAQTLDLCRLHGIEPAVVGAHGGASMMSKATSLAGRTARLARRVRRFAPSLAVAHGSNDLALVARLLGVPACNTFDYEWATLQHNVGCRLARRVVVPQAIPLERLRRYGVTPQRLRQYPGIKEEYYLADFEPDRGLLGRLGVDRDRTVVVVRPPPDVSLYHRRSNPLYVQVLQHVGHDGGVHAVVLPRTQEQRRALRAMALPSVIVPEGAIDGQSLVALADLVISAGGLRHGVARRALRAHGPLVRPAPGRPRPAAVRRRHRRHGAAGAVPTRRARRARRPQHGPPRPLPRDARGPGRAGL